MPKAIAAVRPDVAINAGQALVPFDLIVTDNAGKVLASTIEQDGRFGTIPRQQIAYITGTITAAQVNDAIEARAIAIALSYAGQVIVAADVVIVGGLIQGA